MSRIPRWKPASRRPTFVLHTSIALGWFSLRHSTPDAMDVLQNMPPAVALVPAHWSIQIAEWVYEAEARGDAVAQEIESYFALISHVGIRPDQPSVTRAWPDTLELAQTHSIPVADAAYLELALRRKLPLATVDPPLLAAANAAGVPIFIP